ncbi:MAG: tetratricopeptide repeat protein [Deltaproteobacteria bacterium]|nr:tetratricopeptide repeat protein [Deltaproteobacteria bacterium]
MLCKNIKYLNGRLMAAFLSVTFLLFLSVAVVNAADDKKLPVQGESVKPEVLERSISNAVLEGDWAEVKRLTPMLLSEDRFYEELFVPLLAYSEHMLGSDDKAIEMLNSRRDLLSTLFSISILKKTAAVPGKDSLARLARPYFFEVVKRNGHVNLGIFPKSGEEIALKKAFYEVMPEPDVDMLEIFNEDVVTNLDSYFLGGEVLYEADDKSICVAFVDIGRLKDTFPNLDANREALKLGVITRSGSKEVRSRVIEKLTKAGYRVEDLRMGGFFDLRERAKDLGLVVEITEDTRVIGDTLNGNFKNIEGSVTLTFYNAMTDKSIDSISGDSAIVHLDVTKGSKEAIIETYDKILIDVVRSVAKLHGSINWSNGAGAPLDIRVSTDEVFASNYKYYATTPFGEIKIRNNTGRDFGGVKVIISVKDYFDYPATIEVGRVQSDSEVSQAITVVFNSKVLDITDDTFFQSEVKVIYFDKGKEKSISETHPIYVYEKHALQWDDKGKIASFITSKDPVVIGFSGKATEAAKVSHGGLNRNILKARAVFSAMGVLGIRYMEDPNNPYGVVSGLPSVVDYVQLPRETLNKRSGDCDDLTSLYSSALESLGIRTKLLDAPGHIYMLFDSGVTESEMLYLGFPKEMFVVIDKEVWVPIETTMVGSSFTKAWKKGAESYHKELKELKVIDVHEAWKTFKVPNLSKNTFDAKIKSKDIDKLFPGELDELSAERIENLKRSFSLMGHDGLRKLMVIYAVDGMFDEAISVGMDIISIEKDAITYNNMGNIYYLKQDYKKAVEFYGTAIELEPSDSGIAVNLTRAYLKLGDNAQAKATFLKALSVDAKVKESNSKLYNLLIN